LLYTPDPAPSEVITEARKAFLSTKPREEVCKSICLQQTNPIKDRFTCCSKEEQEKHQGARSSTGQQRDKEQVFLHGDKSEDDGLTLVTANRLTITGLG